MSLVTYPPKRKRSNVIQHTELLLPSQFCPSSLFRETRWRESSSLKVCRRKECKKTHKGPKIMVRNIKSGKIYGKTMNHDSSILILRLIPNSNKCTSPNKIDTKNPTFNLKITSQAISQNQFFTAASKYIITCWVLFFQSRKNSSPLHFILTSYFKINKSLKK